ncbi:hypothetical protein O6H91_01G052400 [Diphasiastrum complanatum]|uniref:Uncharacterized protein n=1 Tax=Diphasiastrum complanatum TaxID=34168 RepID=A0ACC2EQY2_DIPCM|nr:hypothetical protein O6H91_01G052400 [Diphasiastrum complanatum]
MEGEGEGEGEGAGAARVEGGISSEAREVHRIRLQEQALAEKSLQAADQGRAGGRSETGDVDAAAAAAEKLQLQDKASRLPRWTRRETLVLVEAKKAGELRVKKNKEERQQKDSGGSPKSKPVSESKWIYISSFCKQRGVDREANQCRKRWGNLFGDYKRIRDWQKGCSLGGDGSGVEDGESFWLMRNDARKENKLPGSFDPEVFEALESFLGRKTGAAVAAVVPEAVAVVFENGRPTSDEGLFSDIEHPAQEEDVTPDAAIGAGSSTPDPDSYKEQSPTHSNGRKKRKRPFVEPEQQKDQLVALLENNCKVLSEHIEAQNHNNELDRAQRKQQADSLVSVLGKLADALEIISARLQKG